MYALPAMAARSLTPPAIPAWSSVLKQRRLALNLTQEQAAAATNDVLAQRTISNLENGRNESLANLGIQRLGALANALQWTLFELQDATGVDLGLGNNRPLLFEPNVTPIKDVKWLPIRALASAGTPLPTETEGLGWYVMPAMNFKNGVQIFRAEGNSMAVGNGKGIFNGDSLVVDTSDLEPREGKIYLVHDEGSQGICVKRLRRWDNDKTGESEWWLTSDNPAFPPFQLETARVIGRVIAAEGPRDFD
jgi:repressor LexA